MKPLGDRVVLVKEKEQTVGGFVLAKISSEKRKQLKLLLGRCSHLGPIDLVAPSVKGLRRSSFGETHAGVDVKDGDEKYIM